MAVTNDAVTGAAERESCCRNSASSCSSIQRHIRVSRCSDGDCWRRMMARMASRTVALSAMRMPRCARASQYTGCAGHAVVACRSSAAARVSVADCASRYARRATCAASAAASPCVVSTGTGDCRGAAARRLATIRTVGIGMAYCRRCGYRGLAASACAAATCSARTTAGCTGTPGMIAGSDVGENPEMRSSKTIALR